MDSQEKQTDWELIELHYRAGVMTVRQIAKEFGVSHTAIQKRATKSMWVRDLSEKIRQTTQNMVATQVVAKSVATETKLTESQTVKAYSDIAAGIDSMQRDDLALGMSIQRTHMLEVAALGDPEFKGKLEALAERMEKVATDRDLDTFRYVISLPGRVKMTKEIAAAHGVYMPMQRKAFGLDGKDTNSGPYEEMLKSVAMNG